MLLRKGPQSPESFREDVEVSRPAKEDVEVSRPAEEDVGAAPRVEEKREEIRVKQEPVDEFLNINLPNPTPAEGPVGEVVIKQKFIEQCAKRRAPIQDKYRSQFKENMQLKLEIIKLRK